VGLVGGWWGVEQEATDDSEEAPAVSKSLASLAAGIHATESIEKMDELDPRRHARRISQRCVRALLSVRDGGRTTGRSIGKPRRLRGLRRAGDSFQTDVTILSWLLTHDASSAP